MFIETGTRISNPYVYTDFEYIGEEMIEMRAQHILDHHNERKNP